MSRLRHANGVTARLMEAGLNVFSPLSHSTSINNFIDLPDEELHKFWMEQDIAVLEKCELMLVLTLNEWNKSKGVAQEACVAASMNIPVEFIDVWFCPSLELVEKINNREPDVCLEIARYRINAPNI